MAYAYANGEGIARDHKSAEFWWLAAAKTGNVDAEASLGMLYYRGINGQPDYKEAAKWLLKASSHGHPAVQIYLDMMKEDGLLDTKTL
ncbi:hypothetical protein [Mesorhizobium sp.]|uniref:tetratricopeptide repeat protein n=1 Tax=Mesorhizobium sp. TaxID=1871066 RepID=UPI000FEA1E75|nr:hypothetical protein [Mesorhizobium sp.]RWN57829.1 MAG: sel1 repeat family protein [Mesorhizobium sp.]